MRRPSISSRCLEPVTVPAAPRNVSEICAFDKATGYRMRSLVGSADICRQPPGRSDPVIQLELRSGYDLKRFSSFRQISRTAKLGREVKDPLNQNAVRAIVSGLNPSLSGRFTTRRGDPAMDDTK